MFLYISVISPHFEEVYRMVKIVLHPEVDLVPYV